MDPSVAKDETGTVIPFPAVLQTCTVASAAPKRRAQADRRATPDRPSVEALLNSLRGRRDRLEDRLALLSLAIEKLEDQVETKRHLEILPGIS